MVQLSFTLNRGKAGLLVAGLVLLVVGGLGTWSMVERADHGMRAELLQSTLMAAQGLNVERIKALSGTALDLQAPAYLRLKQQLAALRSANPQCRILDLTGRRADGTLFTFMDSEPSTAPAHQPPGAPYEDTFDGIRRVFASQSMTTAGPYTDRQGTWVSALVPIHDPRMVRSEVASPEDARAMVGQAVAFYRANGREKLLAEMNNPKGRFHRGDLYAFAYDRRMTILAHPVVPALVGQNQLDQKAWAGGKFFGREIQTTALATDGGWVNYEFEDPSNNQVEAKSTYVFGLDDLILCAGAYRGNGSALAVLGMDVDARAWNLRLVQAGLPPVLLTLVLAGLLWVGALLYGKRSRAIGVPSRWLLRHETGLVLAGGIVVTGFAVWMAHAAEMRSRRETSVELLTSQTEATAERLRDLRDTQLESLGRFCSGREEVTAEGFRRFTTYLTRNPAVFAWAWVSVVPARDQARFEAKARAKGLKGFAIWARDGSGNRVRASGRQVYYPVVQIAPLEGNQDMLGFDLGSEALRRAGLEEAVRTGMATGTEPITLVQETGNQKGMVVFQPVFGTEVPRRLEGLAMAGLRMGSMLRNGAQYNSSIMGLSLLREGAEPELLGTSWDTGATKLGGLATMRPLFAFGKVFGVSAHANPGFLQPQSARMGWIALWLGLFCTSTLALATHAVRRRREELERLVAARTLELMDNEQSYFEQFNNNSSVMLILGPKSGEILEANVAALEFYGYTREQLLGMGISQINLLPAPAVREAMASVPPGQGRRFTFQHRLADGSMRDVEVSASTIHFGGRPALHTIVHDITTRKRAEEEIRRQSGLINSLLDSMPDLIFFKDLEGVYLGCNPAFGAFVGLAKDAIPGRTDYDLFPRAVADGFRANDQSMLASREAQHFEGSGVYPDGTRVLFDTLMTPYWGPDQVVIGLLGISRDITERIKAMETLKALNRELDARVQARTEELEHSLAELRNSEEHFRALADSAPILIRQMGLGGQILYMNQSCLDFYGLATMADAAGLDWHARMHPDDRASAAPWNLDPLQGQVAQAWEYRILNAAGEYRWLLSKAVPDRSPEGALRGLIGSSIDITAHKQREELLRNLEGLKAKSQMAAYIAHEINNPLAGIKQSFQVLATGIPEDHPDHPFVGLISRELDRIASIVRMAYSIHRPGLPQIRQASVPDILADLGTLLLSKLRSKHLVLELPEANVTLKGRLHEDLLRQMLFNVLQNAIEASPEGGRIRCRARRSGTDLVVGVEDEGPGIAPNLGHKIFELGFTTKDGPEMGGLGSGLATCRSILHSIGGSIDFKNLEPGSGASFIIIIPWQD
jgi:PAS domain S-box-containing protein